MGVTAKTVKIVLFLLTREEQYSGAITVPIDRATGALSKPNATTTSWDLTQDVAAFAFRRRLHRVRDRSRGRM